MKTMDYKTRVAMPGDHDLIYGLKAGSVRPYVEKIWGWDEDYQRSEFERDFAAIEQYHVIEVDASFAGFVQVCFEHPYYEVIELHLLPEYRGKGIGSDILRHLQKDSIVGDRKIRIGCFKENHRAKALYEKLGFVQTAATDTHYILEYSRRAQLRLNTGVTRRDDRHLNDKNESKIEIKGKKVILREQRKEDAKYFAYWFNQPEVMFQCGLTDLTNEAKEIARIERKTEDSVWYTITDLDGNVIGETGLLHMWPVWHCTDLSIMLPDPENQGRGYGTEAIQMMLELAFDQYEMNRIAIGVVAKNTYALEFYEKVGFKKEGIQEQGYYYNKEYSDFIMMRLLKQEWTAHRKATTKERKKGGSK